MLSIAWCCMIAWFASKLDRQYMEMKTPSGWSYDDRPSAKIAARAPSTMWRIQRQKKKSPN